MLADIIVQVIKALGIRTLPLVTIEKNLQSIAEQYELEIRTEAFRHHRSLHIIFARLEDERRILADVARSASAERDLMEEDMASEEPEDESIYYQIIVFDDGSWYTKVHSLNELPYWPAVFDAMYGERLNQICRVTEPRYRGLFVSADNG